MGLKSKMPEETVDRLGEVAERYLLASFDDPSKLTATLPEQIANRLVEGIIKGQYSPGQRLQETALARQFSVSRGPIREALRILERERLVVIRPHHGAHVAALTREDVADIFEVRALLLGLAARKLAEHHTKEAAVFLGAATAALTKALEEPESFLALVYRVSMYLAESAGNPLARAILFSLGRRTLSVTRLALAQRANRLAWVDNWSATVKAITARRSAEADAAMRRLVDTVGTSAIEAREQQASADPARALESKWAQHA